MTATQELKEGAEYKAIQLFLLMNNSKETTLILFGGKSSLGKGNLNERTLGQMGKMVVKEGGGSV